MITEIFERKYTLGNRLEDNLRIKPEPYGKRFELGGMQVTMHSSIICILGNKERSKKILVGRTAQQSIHSFQHNQIF